VSIVVANQPPPAFAWFILVASVLAVSSAGALLQLIVDVEPLLKASWRLQATSLVLLLPFLFQMRRMKNEEPESFSQLFDLRVLGIIAGSAFCLFVHFGSWIWSLDHTSLTHSLLFVTAHPLVIVCGLYLMGRSISKKETSGAIIGFIGAMITLIGARNEGDVTLIGDFAAFVGAVAIIGYLAAGRVLRNWMPLFIYAFPVTFIAAILLGISSLVIEGSSLANIPASISLFGWLDVTWLWIVLLLAFGPGLVGHTGINGVLRWMPPLVISVSVLFEPLIGSLIGWALGTTLVPGFYTWLGGIFLIAGVILVTLGRYESKMAVADG
jgi:drug/metabolite transporter (DMT)-like permease